MINKYLSKSILNPGKILFSTVLISILLLSDTVSAGKKSSKRAGSSQKKSTQVKSSKRAGSSQKKSTQTKSSKRAGSSQTSVPKQNSSKRTSASKSTTSEKNYGGSTKRYSKDYSSKSCKIDFNRIREKDIPNADDMEDLPYFGIFKKKNFTFKEGEFYKLSDLININMIPDYVSVDVSATSCGIGFTTEGNKDIKCVEGPISELHGDMPEEIIAKIKQSACENNIGVFNRLSKEPNAIFYTIKRGDILTHGNEHYDYVYDYSGDGFGSLYADNLASMSLKDNIMEKLEERIEESTEESDYDNFDIKASDLDKYYIHVSSEKGNMNRELSSEYYDNILLHVSENCTRPNILELDFDYTGGDSETYEEFEKWLEKNLQEDEDYFSMDYATFKIVK